MAEESVFFNSGDLKLHGMFSPAAPSQFGAVILHPHPAYGGTMGNNVVMALAHALHETGHATLRFNFRGVGQSEGHYSDGQGEVEDARAAIKFMQEKMGANTPLVLAGYSFGSWVATNALAGDTTVSHLILVAPPTSMFDFSGLTKDSEERARFVVVGERDQFCDRDALKEIFDRLPEPKALRIIPRADHFYFGREKDLAAAVKDAISDHSPK